MSKAGEMTVRRSLLLIGIASAALFVNAYAALADAYFDEGKRLYEKKEYAKAVNYFHKSAQDQPWDSSAAYYEALSYHMIRDYKHAKEAYANVVEHFAGSAAYVNASQALKQLDPDYFNRVKSAATAAGQAAPAAAGAASAEDLALLEKVQVAAPNEAKIPVDRRADKNWVDGSVNGRAFKFDFSGDTTMISQKDAAKMSLPVRNGRAMVTVAVGQISEYNFPLKVADTDRPRLGTDFFHKLSYRLGPTDIVVVKAGAGAYNLAFVKGEKDMHVNLTINGRRVNVVFDPNGGENVCPRNRARELGLDVEDKQEVNMVSAQNPDGAVRGMPGFGEVKQISSAAAKINAVGPVGTGDGVANFKIDDKITEVKVSASAFPGWDYDIDDASKMIHFRRR
jgi:hypothetical protein